MFRKLSDLLKPSADHVSLNDQISWLLHCPPEGCRKHINSHYDIGSCSFHNAIYFDQYLIYYTKFSSSSSLYFGGYCYQFDVYLIDETFKLSDPKTFYTFSTDFCYPLIFRKRYDPFIKGGPWIDKLKNLMNDHGIKQAFLAHKSEIDNQEKIKREKQLQKQQCCEAKVFNVLKNFK